MQAPKQDLISERVIAGRMASDPVRVAAEVIGSSLSERAFNDAVSADIVGTAIRLYKEGVLTGPGALLSELKKKGVLGAHASAQWAVIKDVGIDTEPLDYHLRRVAAAHRLSAQIDAMRGALDSLSMENDLSACEAIVGKAVGRIMTSGAEDDDTVLTACELADLFDAELDSDKPSEMRIPTGYWKLDGITGGGVLPARVFVVAGGTNMGKTVFTYQLAAQVARRWHAQGDPRQVLVFSCENDPTENRLRYVSFFSPEFGSEPITTYQLMRHMQKTSLLPGRILQQARKASALFRELPLVFDHAVSPSTEYIMGRVMSLSLKAPVGMVLFDLIDHTGDRGNTKHERIVSAIHGAHMVASRFGIPFGINSQIKEGTHVGSGVPRLQDLAWSSDLKKIASIVYVVHRPYEDYMQSESEGIPPPEDEFIVAVRKKKAGDTVSSGNMCKLKYDARCLRLYDPEEPEVREEDIPF